ncbi:hypothetical protein FGE12_21645 [Aggregicoccus sp. 17bor-14]|uniref:hypothetical protein n=1 Tax=Myxococcaceae TaxID=31 RepID=UPI00129C3FE2|nr:MULTISPECIES: hypothetical protein [Myxococcaceae]MBF5045021.1 hypothetical protein [Simulacricoccus sp. 17bor-14]MRI90764.1 hypothetical protein [Aggregicoccus sp. 17bor-14]
MKTLAVALLFALSLCSAGLAARAEARSRVAITSAPGGLAAPELLADGGGKGDGGSGGDKGGDKGGDDDERDEEELRVTGRAALELVDPGAAQDVLRLRLAARH